MAPSNASAHEWEERSSDEGSSKSEDKDEGSKGSGEAPSNSPAKTSKEPEETDYERWQRENTAVNQRV